MKKYETSFFLMVLLNFAAILISNCSIAQPSIDNGYFITHPDKLVLRLYLSQKFAPFTISSSKNDEDLNYRTNSKLNLGVGATYRNLTLNVAYGFSFLNKDKGQGKTKGADFQFHAYPHKWAIDLLGAFLKGYYLDPKNKNPLNLTGYYRRPDLKRNIMGLSVFRVPNADKFSYRALLTQNDMQTKSAGSLLYGGEAYYGIVKGDSALVPVQANSNFKQAGVAKVNFFSIGPGIGYAYTLVISKHFFIGASAIADAHINFSSEESSDGKHKKTSLLPGGLYKGALGYNSSTWSFGATILGNILYAGSASSSKEYFLPTGNFRFILAKKLSVKKHA